MLEILYAFGWVAGASLVALGAWALGRWINGARKERPADFDDVMDELQALKRQQRLLQGRLNALAPPREGTGENGPPAAPQSVSMSRSELYRAIRARRGG